MTAIGPLDARLEVPAVAAVLPDRGLKHVLHQAGWGLAANIIGLILRWVLVLVIARHYGALALGVYALSVAVGIGASLAATAGLDWMVLRFVPFHSSRNEHSKRRGIEWLSTRALLISSAVTAVVLAALSAALAGVFHDKLLVDSLRLISLAVPAMAFGQLLRARLRTSEDVRLAVSLEQVAIPGTNLLVILLFLSLGSSTWIYAPVMGQTIGQLLAAGVAGAVLLRSFDGSASGPHTLALPRWFSYGIPMWLESFVVMLLVFTDQLMLGHLTSVEQVGLYTPAARLAALVGVPLLAVNVILAPMMARLDGAGAREKLSRLYGRVNWATAIVGVGSGALLLILGRPLLSLFGAEYASTSFSAFAILIAGQVIATSTGSSGTLLTMTGRGTLQLANAAVALALNIGLCFLLIPRYGLVGAAAGTSISLATISVLQLIQARTVVGLRSFDREGWLFWMGHARKSVARIGRS